MGFTSNIKELIRDIETTQTYIDEAKIDGLCDMAKEAFGQAENKYLIKGNWAKTGQNGKLIYTTPPGADITVNKVVIYNPKTKWKMFKKVAMFVTGKIVSRSGTYQDTLDTLANTNFKEGTNNIKGVRVDISKNGVQVYADSNSEVYKVETHKQLGRNYVSPIVKSFRSIVSLWKRVRIKMNK